MKYELEIKLQASVMMTKWVTYADGHALGPSEVTTDDLFQAVLALPMVDKIRLRTLLEAE